jgi:hypothetical protein
MESGVGSGQCERCGRVSELGRLPREFTNNVVRVIHYGPDDPVARLCDVCAMCVSTEAYTIATTLQRKSWIWFMRASSFPRA